MENIDLLTVNRAELKDIRKAQDAFVNVVKACTDCHNIVRGW